MSVSKKTLAVIYRAIQYQQWYGTGVLNEHILLALKRIVDRKTLDKSSPHLIESEEIKQALAEIGKPNKRNKKAQKAKS